MKKVLGAAFCAVMAFVSALGGLSAVWGDSPDIWNYALCALNTCGCVVWAVFAASIAAGYED
jgi:hypothetical protein